ncbi:Bg selectin 1 [Biomphalaria pfeifferi]|uniref:Bg selectin 1 n=1 Tax=Biomphalaria pfeifferi TaxID=112525 RepID=A0AAD8C130_BIOPF|nr:Bg selectin 1 [Biomphalaria pfeifferi]
MDVFHAYHCFLFLLLLFCIGGEAGITIEISPASNTTQVTCYFIKDKTSEIVHPYSMNLAKSNNNNTFDNIAKISVFSKPQSLLNTDDSFQVDGLVDGAGTSYLQLISTSFTLKSAKIFRCAISGFDVSENFLKETETLETSAVTPSVSGLLEKHNQLSIRLNKLEKRESEFESEMYKLHKANQKRVKTLIESELSSSLTGFMSELTAQLDQKISDLKEFCYPEKTDQPIELNLNASELVKFLYGFSYKRSRYYLSQADVTKVTTAETDCAQYDGYNVEINSLDEYNVIVSTLKLKAKFSGTIIGLTDEGNEGNWYYPSSKKQATILLWNAGEANHDTIENCAVLWQPFNYKMVDIKCSDHYGYSFHFMCEIPFK